LTVLTRLFGSKSQTKLIEYLLEQRGRVFHQAGLSRFLSMSPSTIARVIEPLIEENIIAYDQIGGQMKVFALNEEDEKVKVLLEFYEKIKKI
jgi:predicted transcriptional regulator